MAGTSTPGKGSGGTVLIGQAMPPRGAIDVQEVRVRCAADELVGCLFLPENPRGVVLFAHGSGSGRHSPRNRQVADVLTRAGLAALLLDLLTPAEDAVDQRTQQHRFDIPLLARRFEEATHWVHRHERLRGLRVGYFGASTGAAVALVVAARLGDRVSAVVSRGGRPDLAGERALAAVTAPTMLVVGGADENVLALNEAANRRLSCERRLEIVEGASHLFEEPGALEDVAARAQSWFHQHLVHAEEAA